MKEMVGGCCVCSEEKGWDENPLVYCDGQGCSVAVHQACYGIVTVPSGPWYCRKCESQERSARVRDLSQKGNTSEIFCQLCPSRDGALKKTDSNGWAHVVCALYIPEVRFGNVTTMEPILISLIPPERFNKTCYICEDKRERAGVGACMQCNKTGCKHNFHVTCAQYKGLLCEEAGNMMDNVKYCGYCDYHYSKLKKTSNLKIIPPFKPVPNSTGESPGTSPEKNNQKSGSGADSGSNNNTGSTSAAGTPAGSTSTSTPNINNISPDINSTSKNLNSSKPSLKKGSVANGKPGSGSVNNSSGSSANSSTTPSPVPKIQPSNLFSSGAFSSSLGISRHSSEDKSKGHSMKPEDEGGTEESHSSQSHRSGNGKFSMKSKEYTTVSMGDVVAAVLDRPISSKFDLSSSTSLVGGIESSVSSLPITSTPHRVDKPQPPDIKPHVTLTPIPMRSSDEKMDSRSSKSPALTFPSTFGQTPKLPSTQTSPEVLDREKKLKTDSDLSHEALTPAKRTRHAPENYDSDTESASETWPTRQEEESESQSQSGSQSRSDLHLSRKDRYLGGQHQQPSQSPARMLTHQQAQDMAHWESSSSRSPQVTLERMRFSGREGSPFNPKLYSADYIPKRGPGRPVKRRSGTSRDEEASDMKIPTRSRGRRGGSASINAVTGAGYPRRETKDISGQNSLSNNNGGSLDEREISFDDQPNESNLSMVSSGRGGRHSGPGRKPVTTPSNSNSLPKKPNYDEAPTMTFAQLKAQSSATSDKAPVHMFGNILNPASSMAQKMVDSLSQEIETIAEVTENVPPQTQLTGIPFPGKSTSSHIVPNNGTSAIPPAAPPQTLEELLERQWEQGSQFLMEQAQHLDIAQLLSCLNQLKQDNRALEEHVATLIQRKEHLSAINARLSIPLGSSSTLVSLGPAYCNPASGSHGTPPLGSQGNKNHSSTTHNGSAVPSPQLQQQILQETAAHQSRIPTHPFPGTEILAHGHPQGQYGHGHSHRSHNSGSSQGQGQVFGFPGGHGQHGGLPVPVVVTSHTSPAQHSNSHHPSMSRDSR